MLAYTRGEWCSAALLFWLFSHFFLVFFSFFSDLTNIEVAQIILEQIGQNLLEQLDEVLCVRARARRVRVCICARARLCQHPSFTRPLLSRIPSLFSQEAADDTFDGVAPASLEAETPPDWQRKEKTTPSETKESSTVTHVHEEIDVIDLDAVATTTAKPQRRSKPRPR